MLETIFDVEEELSQRQREAYQRYREMVERGEPASGHLAECRRLREQRLQVVREAQSEA